MQITTYKFITHIRLAIIVIALITTPRALLADDSSSVRAQLKAEGLSKPTQDHSFLPTWRLMDRQQKKQFIAGYLQGFNDAKMVTSIVSDFAKGNPTALAEGVEKMRALYDTGGISSDDLVIGIDEYYSDPDNTDAALARAVSAARLAFAPK